MLSTILFVYGFSLLTLAGIYLKSKTDPFSTEGKGTDLAIAIGLAPLILGIAIAITVFSFTRKLLRKARA